MPIEFVIRVQGRAGPVDVKAAVEAAGAEAAARFREGARAADGALVLLVGDRDYCASLRGPVTPATRALLADAKGRYVSARFAGRSPVRRVLYDVALTADAPAPHAPVDAAAVDLTTAPGCPALWLRADGCFSTTPDASPQGADAREALVNAARWISGRRTSTFERLFPPSAFRPDVAARTERVSAQQGAAMLDQARGALHAGAVGGALASSTPSAATELRSASLTVLSHMVATALHDPSWRALSDLAAAEVFALVESERGPGADAALRAHAILLLQLRAPALDAPDRARAAALVRTLARESPPYDALRGPWNFAMCSGWDFHAGECEVLVRAHGFREVPVPADAPAAPTGAYSAFDAPFRTPDGEAVRVIARAASPSDENAEMGSGWFAGVLINRHAQLGSFDMRATMQPVAQRGYKLMMNSQCAGLTTRFALSRMFPDADLYSSYDSTYFRNDASGKVNASEGLDCFVATLQGMARRETHAQLDLRIKAAQWAHPQADADKAFVQFVGPAHPAVLARYSDVNHDARGDFYDGYYDVDVRAIALAMDRSTAPKDPGVRASQVGGDAARSLGWAVGSMNRVAQYSDLWASLPGRAEILYAFESAGYYSHLEPPMDVPAGPIREDLGLLPAVCRYTRAPDTPAGLRVEVMFHAWLSHAAEELKRLLVAAEAMNRAFDLKHLPAEGPLSTPQARRGAVLLTLAGLLEFPADQNRLDGLWSSALKMLTLPDLSRSLVRSCITEADHDASNYYGSVRGLRQLVGSGADRGDLGRADPRAWDRLASADPLVGRAAPLAIPR